MVRRDTEVKTARPRPTRRAVGVVTVVSVVLLLTAALLAFQPWKIFVDTSVDEALPGNPGHAAAAAAAAAVTAAPGLTSQATPATPATPATTVIARGTFTSFEHRTTGTASILRLADGSHVVRLENLSTSDGPDVHVWLSTGRVSADAQALVQGHVEVGRLKGNLGNQNYVVPRGLDPSRFHSVVIWCERFSVAFGAATVHG
jgi:hypothetical protein